MVKTTSSKLLHSECQTFNNDSIRISQIFVLKQKHSSKIEILTAFHCLKPMIRDFFIYNLIIFTETKKKLNLRLLSIVLYYTKGKISTKYVNKNIKFVKIQHFQIKS